MNKALIYLATLIIFLSDAFAVPKTPVVARPCPFVCEDLGLTDSSECRDWKIGNTCYVADIRDGHRRADLRVCLLENGLIRIRRHCRKSAGERPVRFEEFRGDQGPQGETGATGSQGPQGEDGSLRVFGDGSAGEKLVSSNTTLNDSNPQYTNFTVSSGVTLSVHSGSIIRCTGEFRNDGTIQVLPALKDHPRFAETGMLSNNAGSGGVEAPGGTGGTGLFAGVAKGTLTLGLMGAGNGYRQADETSGAGGGNFTVICKEGVENAGVLEANGSAASSQFRGGGGGGFIILASAESVGNTGTISANGADGGALLATDSNNTGHGPGGGGGGGIVHLIAPTIANTGVININGGSGGAAGAAGSITGLVYLGGGGGGGSGGNGGAGGTVNPGAIGNNSTTAGQDGSSGEILQTVADPVALF